MVGNTSPLIIKSRYKTKRSQNLRIADYFINILYSFTFTAYAIFIGLRPVTVGTDTLSYVNLFNFFESMPELTINYEAGFLVFIRLVKIFTNNSQIFILIIALITTLFIYLSGIILFNVNRRLVYAIFMVLSPFLFSLETNGLRQGMAISICIFSFSISSKLLKNWRRVVLYVTAPFIYFIHLPSLVSWIAFIVYIRRLRAEVIWVISIFISIFTSLYSPIIGRVFNSTKYAVYFDSQQTSYITGIRFDFIAYSSLIIIVSIVMNKSGLKSSKEFKRIITAYCIINSIGMILNFMPFYSRILLASWVLAPIILTQAYNTLSSSKKRRSVVSFIYILGLGIIFYIFGYIAL